MRQIKINTTPDRVDFEDLDWSHAPPRLLTEAQYRILHQWPLEPNKKTSKKTLRQIKGLEDISASVTLSGSDEDKGEIYAFYDKGRLGEPHLSANEKLLQNEKGEWIQSSIRVDDLNKDNWFEKLTDDDERLDFLIASVQALCELQAQGIAHLNIYGGNLLYDPKCRKAEFINFKESPPPPDSKAYSGGTRLYHKKGGLTAIQDDACVLSDVLQTAMGFMLPYELRGHSQIMPLTWRRLAVKNYLYALLEDAQKNQADSLLVKEYVKYLQGGSCWLSKEGFLNKILQLNLTSTDEQELANIAHLLHTLSEFFYDLMIPNCDTQIKIIRDDAARESVANILKNLENASITPQTALEMLRGVKEMLPPEQPRETTDLDVRHVHFSRIPAPEEEVTALFSGLNEDHVIRFVLDGPAPETPEETSQLSIKCTYLFNLLHRHGYNHVSDTLHLLSPEAVIDENVWKNGNRILNTDEMKQRTLFSLRQDITNSAKFHAILRDFPDKLDAVSRLIHGQEEKICDQIADVLLINPDAFPLIEKIGGISAHLITEEYVTKMVRRHDIADAVNLIAELSSGDHKIRLVHTVMQGNNFARLLLFLGAETVKRYQDALLNPGIAALSIQIYESNLPDKIAIIHRICENRSIEQAVRMFFDSPNTFPLTVYLCRASDNLIQHVVQAAVAGEFKEGDTPDGLSAKADEMRTLFRNASWSGFALQEDFLDHIVTDYANQLAVVNTVMGILWDEELNDRILLREAVNLYTRMTREQQANPAFLKACLVLQNPVLEERISLLVSNAALITSLSEWYEEHQEQRDVRFPKWKENILIHIYKKREDYVAEIEGKKAAQPDMAGQIAEQYGPWYLQETDDFCREAATLILNDNHMDDTFDDKAQENIQFRLGKLAHDTFSHRHVALRVIADILCVFTLGLVWLVRACTHRSAFFSTDKTDRERTFEQAASKGFPSRNN